MRRLRQGCLLLVALVGAASVTFACETPVYRYAMYRWQPTPYEVYAFHDEGQADAIVAVENAIAKVSEGTEARANVVFIPVNLATDPDLISVSPDIKQAWTAREKPRLPSYLISTPYGVQIHSGKLDAEMIAALVESPARKQIAQQLEAGKIGVLLMLAGQDEQQNQETRKILQGLVKDVRAGALSLYSVPGDSVPGDAPARASETAGPHLEVGLLEVDRGDEQETWLVKSLLAMEPDLPEETRPMVYLIYGRGRALLPYIGPGITRQNLVQEIQFISGACSCTVKEQNPGVDLLVRYDWDAAAAALADRFGTEEGNESQFGPEDFLPQLIIPTGTPPSDAVAATEDAAASGGQGGQAATSDDPAPPLPGGDPGESAVTQATPGGDAVTTHASENDSGDSGEVAPLATAASEVLIHKSEASSGAAQTHPATASADAADGAGKANAAGTPEVSAASSEVASVTPAVAPQRAVPASEVNSTSSTFGMLVVGSGLAIGLVILFGLTFFIMRPH